MKCEALECVNHGPNPVRCRADAELDERGRRLCWVHAQAVKIRDVQMFYAAPSADAPYCAECKRTFSSQFTLRNHNAQLHR